MNPFRQLLLAQALIRQEQPPVDTAGFERLAGPDGDLAGVTAACFLLYLSERDIYHFLQHVAPRLLAQLARSTEPQRVLLRGRARGSVDWSGTVRARYGGNQDPTLYVCRQSWRLYDLPENRLLKYLLDRLRRCHERTPNALREGSTPALGIAEKGAGVDQRLAFVAHRLRRFSANAYLRDVELPDAVNDQHLIAARRARNPLYGEVAGVYHRYRSVVERPSWQAWQPVVRQNVLFLPRSEDRTLRRLMAGVPAPAR